MNQDTLRHGGNLFYERFVSRMNRRYENSLSRRNKQ